MNTAMNTAMNMAMNTVLLLSEWVDLDGMTDGAGGLMKG